MQLKAGLSASALIALSVSGFGKELGITKPGIYRLGENVTLRVHSEKEPDGLVRNELTVTAQGEAGAKVDYSCALNFGEGTWGVFVKEIDEKPGFLKISMVDQCWVQTFDFDPIAKRARFRRPGFDSECHWMMKTERFLHGELRRFVVPEMVPWAKALIPELSPEPAAAAGPSFELRLVPIAGEPVRLVRPTMTRGYSNPSRLGYFVEMGELVFGDGDLEVTGHSAVSILRTHYGVREGREAAFKASCEKHAGREAALVRSGQVISRFILKPDLNPRSFVASIYGHGLPRPVQGEDPERR